jgi:hypothetical protein
LARAHLLQNVGQISRQERPGAIGQTEPRY